MRLRAYATTIAALVVGATAALSLAATTSAYVLNGDHWANPTSISYYNYTSGVDSTAYTNALQAWNNTPTPVLFVKESQIGDEQVSLYHGNYGATGWDGLSQWIATGSVEYYAWTKINDYYSNSYPADERQSVVGHELGHVLGLGHQPGIDLMNPATCGYESRYCTYLVYTPLQDDINGINAIY